MLGVAGVTGIIASLAGLVLWMYVMLVQFSE